MDIYEIAERLHYLAGNIKHTATYPFPHEDMREDALRMDVEEIKELLEGLHV